MRIAPFAAAVLAMAAASPARAHGGEGLRGNGEKTTTARDVPAFTKVRLQNTLTASVKVGAPQKVAVTIDSNLQPEIVTRVDGDTLVVQTTREIRYDGRGTVEISVPALRGFEIDGSGDATIDGGEGDLALAVDGSGDLRFSGRAAALRVSIAGAGNVSLAGRADRLDVDVEGSGGVRARELTATGAKVAVSGSGDVELTLAGGPLSAAVAGSGDVTWWGDAQVQQTATSGSGEIRHR